MADDAPTPPSDDAARTVPDAPTLVAASEPAGRDVPATGSPGSDDPAADDDDAWEYVDDDEPDEPDEPPTPRGPSRTAELLALSAFCIVIGGMLAGAVLGVLYAPMHPTTTAGPQPPSPPRVRGMSDAGAVALASHDRDAMCDVDEAGASQEADPEIAGDGVMDDLDDGPAEPLPPPSSSAPSGPPSPRPLLARSTPPTATPRPRRMITSDDVPEGPVEGYIHGRPVRITVTRIDGKPVEVHTAAAYRRMREAAQRDGITLRIVSGFRTMEHQQALYRAYRLGRGNLAAMPGHSNHQSGHALDLNTSAPGVFRWLTRHARRFGFRRTVPTEPWHWEWW
jgi:hypothetical protein